MCWPRTSTRRGWRQAAGTRCAGTTSRLIRPRSRGRSIWCTPGSCWSTYPTGPAPWPRWRRWLLVEDADTALQPLACLDDSGPAQRRANRLRDAVRELLTRRGADLRFGRTLPRALREAGLADVAAAGSFPVGGLACDRLEAATIRHVRGELLAAGLADDAELDAHLAAIGAGELDLTLSPLISAWGRRPAEPPPAAG
jgi:hypothetical protein